MRTAATTLLLGSLVGACSFEVRPNNGGIGLDATPDAEGTGLDAQVGETCYGPAGAWQVCLGAAPADPVVLPATIDTGTSPLCLVAQPAGWAPAQPAACFIVGKTISVPATTIVTGPRPLVLVANDAIAIDGVLDVASHVVGGRVGPGSPGAPCAAGTLPAAGNAGGGGGGGSFQTKGGDGGKGDDDTIAGGRAGAEQTLITTLRAGCPGQRGGRVSGTPGAGGGAVFLVAGGSILITGTINASGSGATGALDRSGGSGGGSGGMIALAAPNIQTGTLIANGGGGAGGGAQSTPGSPGADPTAADAAAAGGPGGDTAGAGGDGSLAALDGKKGGGTKDHQQVGGGGGGGGAGFIAASIAIPLTSTISPPVQPLP